MIKNLHVGFKDSHFQHLFDWNKIPKDKYNKIRLLNYLKYSLKIDLDYYENIEILNNNNIIQIIIDSDKKIIMKKDSVHFVDVTYLNKDIKEKSFSFLIKNKHQICIPSFKNKNTLESFFDMFYNKKILFLDKELKLKYQNLINQKQESYKQIPKQSHNATELNNEIEEISSRRFPPWPRPLRGCADRRRRARALARRASKLSGSGAQASPSQALVPRFFALEPRLLITPLLEQGRQEEWQGASS